MNSLKDYMDKLRRCPVKDNLWKSKTSQLEFRKIIHFIR